MEISGKIIAKLPLQEGVAKASGRNWKKQEYVLETHDSFPRKVKFDFFGERVDQYPLEIGEEVTVSYDLESREFNGRWYTDVRAWKADKGMAPAATASAQQMASVNAPDPFGAPAPQPGAFASPENAQDDLPF